MFISNTSVCVDVVLKMYVCDLYNFLGATAGRLADDESA